MNDANSLGHSRSKPVQPGRLGGFVLEPLHAQSGRVELVDQERIRLVWHWVYRHRMDLFPVCTSWTQPVRRFALIRPSLVTRLFEPKGRTYGALDILFEQRIPARKFASTQVDEFAAEGRSIADRGVASGAAVH